MVEGGLVDGGGLIIAACHSRASLEQVVESCGALGHDLRAFCAISAALPELRKERSQLVILEDGEEPAAAAMTQRVCRELRERRRSTYVLVVAAELRPLRELTMIREGADYYVAPLEGARLTGYVHSLMLRALEQARPAIAIDQLVLDAGRRACTADGTALPLTPTEFDILFRLATARGQVVSLRELAEQILNVADNPAARACVRQHVYSLGKKSAHIARVIKTVHGRGYLIEGAPCRAREAR